MSLFLSTKVAPSSSKASILSCFPTSSLCPIRCSTMCKWPAKIQHFIFWQFPNLSSSLLAVCVKYHSCHHYPSIKWSHPVCRRVYNLNRVENLEIFWIIWESSQFPRDDPPIDQVWRPAASQPSLWRPHHHLHQVHHHLHQGHHHDHWFSFILIRCLPVTEAASSGVIP